MDTELFNELLDSIKEAGQMKRAQQTSVSPSEFSILRNKPNDEVLSVTQDKPENRLNEVIHAA